MAWRILLSWLSLSAVPDYRFEVHDVGTVSIIRLQERQEKGKKTSSIKLDVEKARVALLKLVDGDLERAIRKLANPDDAKRIMKHIASRESRQELKCEKVTQYKHMKGVRFIGNWAIVVNEQRFYIVVGHPKRPIWVEGHFALTKNRDWHASIINVAVGYEK